MTAMRLSTGFMVSVTCMIPSAATAQIVGDYNLDGVLDAADLNLQAMQIVNGPFDPSYDLNNDGRLNFEDREAWVHDLKNTYFGDANLDQRFNSSDLVQVFVAGKYETGEDAGWEEGDWNADMRFASGDLVTTFIECGYDSCAYENGRRKTPAREPLPEPSGWLLSVMAIVSLLTVRRRA